MIELNVALIGLAVSGLGYISYHRPEYARKILMPLWISIIVVYLLLLVYNNLQINAYKSIENTVIDSFIDYYTDTSVSNNDSIQNRNKVGDIGSNIIVKIDELKNKSDSTYKQYSFYFGYAGFIIIILIVLSFISERIKNEQNINDNDKTV